MSETKRIFLTDKDRISVCENNLVTLTMQNGEVYETLEPRRLFPVNNPDHYITLIAANGSEVAVVRSINDLDRGSKKILCESLENYYLIPHITKIVNIIEKYGNIHWCVETDRGYKEFDIKNRNADIKAYPDGTVRLRDADDNRYIIDNYRKLDKRSIMLITPDT